MTDALLGGTGTSLQNTQINAVMDATGAGLSLAWDIPVLIAAHVGAAGCAQQRLWKIDWFHRVGQGNNFGQCSRALRFCLLLLGQFQPHQHTEGGSLV